jgi:alginate O-acetyltransferase complex protein AlgI
MAYHLLTYSLIFLPVVIALYQLCPARFRFVVLLAADYTFFCMISGKLLVWLLLATLVTYGTGRWLAAIPVRHSDLHGKALTRKKRGVLALGIVLILGTLVTLKYLRVFGVTLAAPIGISYYSLQAISYMTDVYRGTQESCKNPVKVALYLSFFPQIMEGPISRFSETADALYGGNSIQFENLVFGYQRIIWGLFKKMVIADRLAPLVVKVFSSYNNFDGAAILVGVLAYTMQLYMEFSGCMDIIMGSGEIFGVPLPENFRQPFFAKNAGDFWRRWHITLGAWLKDLTCQASEESGEENQEESWIFGQQIRGTDDCVILCLAVKRHLAWTTYELYFLWYVLFCADRDRESDGGTVQEAGGAIQA